MKYLALLLIFGFGISAFGQTIKSLGYNTTNGQVVANTGTNVLTFTNNLRFSSGDLQFNATQIVGNGLAINFDDGAVSGGPITLDTNASIAFQGASAASTRANLGFSTNLNTLWTATNASNARSAVGLGATWLTNTNASNFRTAINLGWPALTNSNTSVRLAGFNTNNQLVTENMMLLLTNRGIAWTNNQNPYIWLTDGLRESAGTNWTNVGLESYDAFVDGQGISFGLETPTYTNNAFYGVFGIDFYGNTNAMATTRANLGFSTNLNTLWTATNASAGRSALGASRAVIWRLKESNQTNNSTSVLTNDSVLSFTAEANTKYFVTLTLMFPSLTGSIGVVGKINASNGATVYGAHFSYDDGVGFNLPPYIQLNAVAITNEQYMYQAYDTVNTVGFVQVPFVVVAGTNASAVTYQFRRTSGDYSLGIIGAGSTMRAEIIE